MTTWDLRPMSSVFWAGSLRGVLSFCGMASHCDDDYDAPSFLMISIPELFN
jgi:hypothetical protein